MLQGGPLSGLLFVLVVDWTLEQLSARVEPVGGVLCACAGDIGRLLSALEHLALVAPVFEAVEEASGFALHPGKGVPAASACCAMPAGRSPTQSGGLAAMSLASKALGGDSGLGFQCFALNRWASGHRLHMVHLGCVGHPDTHARNVCCPHARDLCSRATFCDSRRMPLREWLALTPDVEADARAGGERARRVVIMTLAYHKVRALWTPDGCRRNSSAAEAWGMRCAFGLAPLGNRRPRRPTGRRDSSRDRRA